MSVQVVWMHVTHGDRVPPNSLVLSTLFDRRVMQWWDPYRLVSKTMLRDFAPESAAALADTSGGSQPLIWNLAAMWRPGVMWNDSLPQPDYAGHPLEQVIDQFRVKLGELSRGRTQR